MSSVYVKSQARCETCARKTILIGLVANLFLAAFKLFVGFLGRSRALIGSGMCNLSDISSSLVVIIGVKFAKKPANKRYPYGYGKIEFIAQVAMSFLMIVGTIALVLSSFIIIAKRILVIPHLVVFFTAVVSAVINGLIYKFAHCGSKELNSPVLKAHAEHNKIDVISSLLVAIGVVVARKGMHWVDPTIAIFECLHIIHGSVIILNDGLKGVMDTALADDYSERMKETILQVDGVQEVDRVRARQAGRHVVLNIVMQLNPNLTVIEAKKLLQAVKSHLRNEDRHIGSISIEVVPTQ